jgi:hypothetical protein
MNYYNVGSRENIVVSNSSMSSINPLEGGSPRRFMSFFDEREEEKEKTSLNRGKLLHAYMENKELFAISNIEKPGGDMGKFIDELYRNITTFNVSPDVMNLDIDITINSDLKRDAAKSAEILQTKASYSDLANLIGIDNDNLIKLFRLSRLKEDFYSSYKEATVIEKFKNVGLEYFNALKSLEGKTILTKADKDSLDGAINSLYTNRKIVDLLNLDDKKLDDIEIIKEEPIYFTLIIDGIELNCKIKPDFLRINHKSKKIFEIDLKSTTNIYTFPKSFEYYNYDRQHGFYGYGIKERYSDYDIIHYNPVVETIGLFQSSIYKVDNSYLLEGRNKAMSCLQRIAWHKNTNIWNISKEEHEGNGILILKKDESITNNS